MSWRSTVTLPTLMLLAVLLQRTENFQVNLEYDVPAHQNETLHVLLDLLDPQEVDKSQEIQYGNNFKDLCNDYMCLRDEVSGQQIDSNWDDVCNASLKLSIPVLPSDRIESILRSLLSWDFRLRDLQFDALNSTNAYLSSGNISLALKAVNLTTEYVLGRRAWISDMRVIQSNCSLVHFSDSNVIQNRSRDLKYMITKLSIATSFYSLQQDVAIVFSEITKNNAIDAHDRFFNSSEYEMRICRLQNCSDRLDDAHFTLEYLENVTSDTNLSFPWAASFLAAVADELDDLRDQVEGKIHSLEKQLTTGIIFRDYVDRIVYFIMAVFGLTWNTALLYILTRYKDACTPPNIILFNFAIVDILNLCIKMPCYYITKYYSPTLYISVNACRTFVSFRVTLLYAIKFSVLTLSAQRYTATITSKRITSYSGLSARQRGILLSLTVWVGALVFGVPPGIFYHFSSDVCIAQVIHPSPLEGLDIFYIVFACIVLPIPIAAFSLLTARRLRRSIRRVSGAESQRCARIRSARVVTAIALVFVATQIPRSFWFCYAAWFHINRRQPLFFYIDVVVVYLFYLNSCLNPVALYIASSELRRHFNSIFFWWLWRQKLSSSVSLKRTDTNALTNFT